jgi:Glycosyl transferase family 11
MSLPVGIFKFFKKKKENLPVVIVFAGGMGTQILQAATYFYYKNQGLQVFADLSYFDRPLNLAKEGEVGQLTHWHWQLDQYNLQKNTFDISPCFKKGASDVIVDGQRMLEIGLSALVDPDINKKFQCDVAIESILNGIAKNSYLCLHIRRGDYVNVASHLISDNDFLVLIKKFSKLTSSLVTISDSVIQNEFRRQASTLFENVLFLDNIDAYESHQIMRHARILVCSNSTFSLTAAALNSQALIVLPKKWFGDKDRHIEIPIHNRCLFQLMK